MLQNIDVYFFNQRFISYKLTPKGAKMPCGLWGAFLYPIIFPYR
jgi:hypothetical protein